MILMVSRPQTGNKKLKKIVNIIITFIDVIDDQGRLWMETIADDAATEADVLRGDQIATDINPKLYHDLQVILSRLVPKASQLIDNVTTNLAESWMHMRSKYDGGKVINRSQSGSWEHRCMGAGLQQNEGKEWGPGLWKEMTNRSPSPIPFGYHKLYKDFNPTQNTACNTLASWQTVC